MEGGDDGCDGGIEFTLNVFLPHNVEFLLWKLITLFHSVPRRVERWRGKEDPWPRTGRLKDGKDGPGGPSMAFAPNRMAMQSKTK